MNFVAENMNCLHVRAAEGKSSQQPPPKVAGALLQAQKKKTLKAGAAKCLPSTQVDLLFVPSLSTRDEGSSGSHTPEYQIDLSN